MLVCEYMGSVVVARIHKGPPCNSKHTTRVPGQELYCPYLRLEIWSRLSAHYAPRLSNWITKKEHMCVHTVKMNLNGNPMKRGRFDSL